LEIIGARTVPVRSARLRRSLENSPVVFIGERAADGDRPRSKRAKKNFFFLLTKSGDGT
jgi:hypothetical protein